MRALVISDTHGSTQRVFKLMDEIGNMIDAVIHLGDIVEDAEAIRTKYRDIPVYNVRGNCDYGSGTAEEALINLNGHMIYITHGHRFRVDMGRDSLAYKGLEAGAELCLYGHTHIPKIEQFGKLRVMNPGSLSQPRGGSQPSYGVIIIDESGMELSLVNYSK